jgi:hypothetical protein
MKQFCVDYIGMITILAESREEALEKFRKTATKAVEELDNSNWVEAKKIEYICDVYKHTSRSRWKQRKDSVERVIRLTWRWFFERRRKREERGVIQ